MAKIRTTINLTPEQKKKLETYHIESLIKGEPRSYSELIGDAIDRCYVWKEKEGGTM